MSAGYPGSDRSSSPTITTGSVHTEATGGDRPDHRAFPALDGIRGLAVLMVIATHSAYWTGRYERGPGAAVLARLDIGVALFFVLSGFLLVQPWLVSAATSAARPSAAGYFWRRAVRILPAYWLAVGLAFVLVDGNRAHLNGWDYLRHATLTQTYGPGGLRPDLTQMWSLCVEVGFYLVLPMVGWAAVWWSRRSGWRPDHLLIGCALLASVTVGFVAAIHGTGWWITTTASTWLPAYLDWFAGGMALAVVTVHLRVVGAAPGSRWRAADRLGVDAGYCWLMAAAVFAVAITPAAGPRAIGLPSPGTAIIKSVLYLVVAVLLVWPAVVGDRAVADRLFANPVMRRLGDISYSMFLLHLVVLDVVVMPLLGYRAFTGSAVAVFVLTTALTAGAAWLSYRLVEVPASRMRGWVRG